ncbi:M15 family metallopeptidase [Lysobacter sp. 2RAF19]
MPKNTAQLRRAWKAFECEEGDMVLIPFGPDKIRVAPPTTQAFEALAAVLHHHGYTVRTQDTDSYNCRAITGGTGKSLHSYGIALDVNWETNPYNNHPGTRQVRYSNKETQALRALDVRHGVADTDMTKAMIDDVRKIRTRAGVAVFEWGGSWSDRKDCMHFEMDVSPEELAVGLDPDSVVGLAEYLASLHLPAFDTPASVAPAQPAILDRQEVIARSGLRLRSGPSADSDVIRVVPAGTQVNVLARQDGWALVDFLGDSLADGFMSAAFLRPVGEASHAREMAERGVGIAHAVGDITGSVTVDRVATMFPQTRKANIEEHLPSILAGLRDCGLGDRQMVLMALSTIRAESEGFRPISEGISGFNTNHQPFDRYEPGTSAGNRVGNTHAGDGARFKGRGFVQLTGRENYGKIGRQVGVDLLSDPERANDGPLAGRILAQFLKNNESRVRAALAAGDLRTARKCVNGGSHGMERFRSAWELGELAFPG